MWVYFNKDGTQQIKLKHGEPARQGSSGVFEIFAYFEDLIIDDTVATIDFKKPSGDVVPVTFAMEKSLGREFKQLSSEDHIAPFESGQIYNGYSFINKDLYLYDEFGMWSATIKIYTNDTIKVQGLIKFNVEEGIDNDGQCITTTEFEEIQKQLASKLEYILFDTDVCNTEILKAMMLEPDKYSNTAIKFHFTSQQEGIPDVTGAALGVFNRHGYLAILASSCVIIFYVEKDGVSINFKILNNDIKSRDIFYNNSNSNLKANTVQDAIDEVAETDKNQNVKLSKIENDITDLIAQTVKNVPQEMTDEQKEQARKNIGLDVINAKDIVYDNTKSHFLQKNVQDILDVIVVRYPNHIFDEEMFNTISTPTPEHTYEYDRLSFFNFNSGRINGVNARGKYLGLYSPTTKILTLLGSLGLVQVYKSNDIIKATQLDFNTLKNYAKIDGLYELMTVGYALGLVDPLAKEPNKSSFISQVTANGDSIKNGVAVVEKIGGNTVIVNQVVPNDKRIVNNSNLPLPPGQLANVHVFVPNGIFEHSYMIYVENESLHVKNKIIKSYNPDPDWLPANGFDVSGKGKFESRYSIFDLTLAFGSGNEPETAEEAYERGIPQGYVSFTEGLVVNATPHSLTSIGTNLADLKFKYEIPNLVDSQFFEIKPNTKYGFKIFNKDFKISQAVIQYYDENKKNIVGYPPSTMLSPSNARYAQIQLAPPDGKEFDYNYNYENLKTMVFHDAQQPTEFIPYTKDTLITEYEKYFPNGMNGIGYSRDTLEKDKATQRFGVVDLSTLTADDLVCDSVFRGDFHFANLKTHIVPSVTRTPNILCTLYETIPNYSHLDSANFVLYVNDITNNISFTDSDGISGGITPSTEESINKILNKFKQNNAKLIYELATPIVSLIDPPRSLGYNVENNGTETWDSEVPVYTEIVYKKDLALRLANLEPQEVTNGKFDKINSAITKLQNNAVTVEAQNFNDEQKVQARKNIGLDNVAKIILGADFVEPDYKLNAEGIVIYMADNGFEFESYANKHVSVCFENQPNLAIGYLDIIDKPNGYMEYAFIFTSGNGEVSFVVDRKYDNNQEFLSTVPQTFTEDQQNQVKENLGIPKSFSGIFVYKGSVKKYSDLPKSNNEIGDVWNVEENDKNYAWDGKRWDDLGGIIDISGKLDKATEQEIVYATNNFGNQITLHYNTEPYGNGIVRRTSTGTIKATKPVENNDVATKEYVDVNGTGSGDQAEVEQDTLVFKETSLGKSVVINSTQPTVGIASKISVGGKNYIISSEDSLEFATYATGKGGLTQLDALTILDVYNNYEGKIIQFYANELEPTKLVSIGWVVKTLDNEPVLIEIDRDGHTIKWTKTSNYDANDSIIYREI